MNYYIDCLTTKYFCFEGRARRKEYWMFALFNGIVGVAISWIASLLAGATGMNGIVYLASLYNLAVFIPGLAVSVRRLHDIGKSGWWFLILLVPIIGAIVFLVFCCLDSQPGGNKYGPNPKGF